MTHNQALGKGLSDCAGVWGNRSDPRPPMLTHGEARSIVGSGERVKAGAMG